MNCTPIYIFPLVYSSICVNLVHVLWLILKFLLFSPTANCVRQLGFVACRDTFVELWLLTTNVVVVSNPPIKLKLREITQRWFCLHQYIILELESEPQQ
ncbi:unnamed protein product, partial [Dicrocoelium dendriticum]